MKLELTQALDNVEVLYSDVVSIANDMLSEITGNLDALVNDASSRIESMTNEEIRALIGKLSMSAFSLVETKEKAALKSRCAEILKDEEYATNYIGAEGKVEERKNAVTLKVSHEIVVEALYDLIASLLKTKLDSCYRMIDALKTILITRNNDLKMSSEGE